MAISLLGPLQVDGVEVLAPRDRVVLAALAMCHGQVLPAERLAEAVWGESVPKSWRKVVQGCLVRVRRVLGPGAIETTSAGYRLAVGDDDVDLRLFERLVVRGRSALASGEPERAVRMLREALGLWRGPVLSDLREWPVGRAAITRLEEVRRDTEEALLAAELAAGEEVAAQAAVLVTEEPLREHRWVLLAQALYRAGRQSEALGAVRRAGNVLREELGLDPGAELVAIERAILNHDPALSAPGPGRADRGVCPYKGLLAYDQRDTEWYFGRAGETAECLRALAASALLVVVGPSGCGKSSLVRAGVVAALARAGQPMGIMTPGVDPDAALTAARAGAAPADGLVVDQLEELFAAGRATARGDKDGKAAVGFLDRLAELAGAGTPVIAVLRSDRMGELATAPAFARLAERGLHLVTPMTSAQLREAIECPAEQAGLRLEPGLVELLLGEVEGEPGALPLLSHALAGTWDRRAGRLLSVDAYLATGGIRGAVAQSAERLYESLLADGRAALRAIMLRLVCASPDGEPVAVRVPLATVGTDPGRQAIVDLLVRARLVTADEHSVVIAHEAVVRAWPRLRTWLDEDADSGAALRHLTVAADDWNARGRPDSELYRGARLGDALARRGSWSDLTRMEEAFLAASAECADAERDAAISRQRQQVRQNRRLRTALAAITMVALIALAAGVVAVQQRLETTRTAAAAQVQRLVAESTALRATRRDLAALLAVEAHRLRPDATTLTAVLGVVTAAPGFLDNRLAVTADGPMPQSAGHVLPDGHTLLASGADAVVRAFDLDNGGHGVEFPPPGLPADGGSVAVSADGRSAAAIAWQGSAVRGGRAVLNVYDVATRQRRLPEVEVAADPAAVAISPEGRFIAVAGGRNGQLLMIDTAIVRFPSAAPIGPGAGVPGVVELPATAPAPDIAQPDGVVRHTAAIAFREDGLLIVGGLAGELRVVDPATGAVVERFTGAPFRTANFAVARSRDGRVLVTSGTDGFVRWDPDARHPVWSVAGPAGQCASIAVAEQVGEVLCGDSFGRVIGHDLGTGVPTGSSYDLQHGSVSALLLTPDRSTLVALSSAEPVITRWRLDGTGPLSHRLPTSGIPTGYNRDGRLLLVDTAPPDRAYRDPAVIDARTGAVLDTLDGYALAIWTQHPTRVVAWTTDGGIGHVLDIDTRSRGVQLNGGLGIPPQGAAAAAERGRVVVWGDADKTDTVAGWDLDTGDPAGRSAARAGDRASLSADGEFVVLALPGGRGLQTRAVDSWKVIAQHPDLVNATILPSGLVAASTALGQIGFYDLATLQPVGPSLPGTPGPVEEFASSADGRLLAVHGADATVRLVDVATRIVLGDSIELSDATGGIALRPDGEELALSSAHGVILWDLRAASWNAAACRAAGRHLTPEEWATHIGPTGYRPTCP